MLKQRTSYLSVSSEEVYSNVALLLLASLWRITPVRFTQRSSLLSSVAKCANLFQVSGYTDQRNHICVGNVVMWNTGPIGVLLYFSQC